MHNVVAGRPNSLSQSRAGVVPDEDNSFFPQVHASLRTRHLPASFLSIIMVLAAAAVSCIEAGAQVRFGSILGTVSDPAGQA